MRAIVSHTLIILFFCLALFPKLSFSQKNGEEANVIIEQRIEYLSEITEESDVDYTTIFDQLMYHFNHPLNLNRASLSDLQELLLLNDIQINYLLEHIEKNGKLMTLEELQTIEGFTSETIQLILPFVKVGTDVNSPQLTLKELLKNGTNNWFVRYQRVLEGQKGYRATTDSALLASPNSRYLGSADKIYTRYRYNYGTHISMGFTAEKDAGEEFFNGTQKQGFDFYSAHFFIKNQGKIKALALGDYQAQFGQGLTYWSGIAFGKSADIMSVKKSAIGLKPYTSVDENRFLRGAGLSMQFGKVETTGFFSRNKIDANIDLSNSDLNDADVLAITSIQQTGFHRTINEVEDKHAINQQQAGGHVAYKTRNLEIGVTGIYSEIDAEFNPTLQLYSQFRNQEKQQANVGLDYNWVYKNFNFFGEYSKSIDAGYAYVSGALITLDPRLSLSVLYRDYAKDFHPIASEGIGESSNTDNERGFYMGAISKLSRKFTLSAYYDQFSFSWLRFGVNAPSRGNQYLAQLTYKPSKKMEMYVRVRSRDKAENTQLDLSEGIDYLVREKQTNYRYNFVYKLTDAIKLKSRVELINYDKEDAPFETGYLVYQDIIYKALSSPFSFSFRYALFDTDSYNSRIYAYENDVLYQFTIPAYSNRGTRTYLTMRYQIKRGIDVWLRYGLTFYDNLDVIGSGLDEIQANHKQEIKAQIRFKF